MGRKDHAALKGSTGYRAKALPPTKATVRDGKEGRTGARRVKG